MPSNILNSKLSQGATRSEARRWGAAAAAAERRYLRPSDSSGATLFNTAAAVQRRIR